MSGYKCMGLFCRHESSHAEAIRDTCRVCVLEILNVSLPVIIKKVIEMQSKIKNVHYTYSAYSGVSVSHQMAVDDPPAIWCETVTLGVVLQ